MDLKCTTLAKVNLLPLLMISLHMLTQYFNHSHEKGSPMITILE